MAQWAEELEPGAPPPARPTWRFWVQLGLGGLLLAAVLGIAIADRRSRTGKGTTPTAPPPSVPTQVAGTTPTRPPSPAVPHATELVEAGGLLADFVSPDPAVRAAAEQKLATLELGNALGFFWRADGAGLLAAGDPAVRVRARTLLTEIVNAHGGYPALQDQPDALKAHYLINRFKGEGDPALDAIGMIGRLGRAAAEPALLDALAEPGMTDFAQGCAVRGLGECGAVDQLELLLRYLLSTDPQAYARQLGATGAIRILHADRLFEERHLPTLTKLLAAADPELRCLGAQVIASVGGPQAATALAGLLKDESTAVRQEALKSLGALKGLKPEELRPLAAGVLAVLLHDASYPVREQAAQTVARLRAPETVPGLIDALQDRQGAVRRAVALALRECALAEPQAFTAEALRALGERLCDDEPTVALEAVRTLTLVGTDEALGVLQQGFSSRNRPEPAVRREILRGLAVWKTALPAEARALLRQALREDGDPAVRAEAAGALSRLAAPPDDPTEDAALAAAAADESEGVRYQALTALALREAVGQLGVIEKALLEDASAQVRRQAAAALASLNDEGRGRDSSAAVLERALYDKDREVREEAARALGFCGLARSVQPLVALLGDRQAPQTVRRRSTEALGRIGGAEAVRALVAALGEGLVAQDADAALVTIGLRDPELPAQLEQAARELKTPEARQAVDAFVKKNYPDATPYLPPVGTRPPHQLRETFGADEPPTEEPTAEPPTAEPTAEPPTAAPTEVEWPEATNGPE